MGNWYYNKGGDIEVNVVNYPNLRQISFGDYCFRNARILELTGLNALQGVAIGLNSFTGIGIHTSLRIVNCNSLSSIQISDASFADFHSIELRGLPSLVSIVMGERCFSSTKELEISGYHSCDN